MKRFLFFLWLSVAAAGFWLSGAAWAGDEDSREEKKATAEQKAPVDTTLPQDAEAPEMSMGAAEEPTPPPDYQEIKPAAKPAPPLRPPFDPDKNVEYGRILTLVEPLEPSRGVLPPALGFRGYRPSMVAIGAGDRTPGFGAMVEYSWNRIGAGIFASYLNHRGEDRVAESRGFAGVYGLYRWLPFDVSPFFLTGVEGGSQTDESIGGLLGLGVEARIYSGYTLLLGWTHHSTVHRGYLGGALGWSF